MLDFIDGREPYNYTMKRDGYRIGYLQCNPGFEPRIIIEDTDRLGLGELQQIIGKCDEVAQAAAAEKG